VSWILKMPQQPDATFAADIDVDDSKKWILKLVDYDEQPSKFRDRRKDAMSCIWKFTVHDLEDGVAIVDNVTNELYELWQWTSDGTYDNPTTGKIAPGREIVNALVGHRTDDDEVRELISDGWGKALLGKSSVADLEWYSQPDGTQRLRVLRHKPYRKPKKEPEAVAAAPKRSRQLDDDDEDT